MFRFPRFTDYGKTTSGLQRRAEVFSCWDYCACGEIQESEAHCQAIWWHTKIGKLTLRDIRIHILPAYLHTCPLVLTRRVRFTIKASFVGDHFLNSLDPNECVRSIIFCRGKKMTVLGQDKTKDKKRFLSQARTTFFILSFALSWKLLFIQLLLRQARKSPITFFLKIMIY